MGEPEPTPRVAAALATVRRLADELAPLEGSLPAGPRHEPDGRLRGEVVQARAQIRRAGARAGVYALHLPVELGGGGLERAEMMLVEEDVYRRGMGLFKDVLAWTEGPGPHLMAADADQREEFVAPLVRAETTACFALTEPGAGSDVLGIRARAARDGSDWVLDGHKGLITWAPFFDVAVVVARTAEQRGPDALSAFFVPRDTPGLRFAGVNRTIMDDGATGELRLESCRIPDRWRLGEVGAGFAVAMAYINWRRVCRGGMCAGLGAHLLERTLSHVTRRRAFERPLGAHQLVQALVADMYLDLGAMRAYALDCLRRLDGLALWPPARPSPEALRLVSAVKVFCDEALYRLADRAVQAHGGWGLVVDAGLEEIFRIARNLRIPAGTDEIQRLTIARTLGLGD